MLKTTHHMNAILTTVITDKKSRKLFIIATTASGKTCKRQTNYPVHEHEHAQAAISLSGRMGWGFEVIGGETKNGFAYIPFKPSTEACNLSDVKAAAETLIHAAAAFPSGEKDPIRIAAGIMNLAKQKTL